MLNEIYELLLELYACKDEFSYSPEYEELYVLATTSLTYAKTIILSPSAEEKSTLVSEFVVCNLTLIYAIEHLRFWDTSLMHLIVRTKTLLSEFTKEQVKETNEGNEKTIGLEIEECEKTQLDNNDNKTDDTIEEKVGKIRKHYLKKSSKKIKMTMVCNFVLFILCISFLISFGLNDIIIDDIDDFFYIEGIGIFFIILLNLIMVLSLFFSIFNYVWYVKIKRHKESVKADNISEINNDNKCLVINNSIETKIEVNLKKSLFYNEKVYELKYTYKGNLCFCENYDSFKLGDIVRFRKEEDNPYDHQTIAAIVGNNKIGLMYKGDCRDTLHKCFDLNKYQVVAYVIEKDEQNKKVRIIIGFYNQI